VTSTERKVLLDTITARYGSLEEPNYSFVEEVVRRQPYAQLLGALSKLADVEETTDLNNDVSFRYVLRHDSQSWALDVSMVGPFGLLLRLGTDREVVTDQSDEGREREIVRTVKEAGVSLLSREVLETRIPFHRLAEESHHATIYNALISDEPLLPWTRAA
jgi:hypothetical protein